MSRTWWVVVFRRVKEPERVYRVLVCKNGHRAGHNGFTRVARPRKWGFTVLDDFRLGYKFAELSDAIATIRGSTKIKQLVKERNLFVDILEFAGEIRGNDRRFVQLARRMFQKGTPEMMILALEASAGCDWQNAMRTGGR